MFAVIDPFAANTKKELNTVVEKAILTRQDIFSEIYNNKVSDSKLKYLQKDFEFSMISLAGVSEENFWRKDTINAIKNISFECIEKANVLSKEHINFEGFVNKVLKETVYCRQKE